MYYVYILYSEKLDKYYVGSSFDVIQRVNRHNRGHSNFTKTGIPWVLVYTEQCEDRTKAYAREMFIKNKKSKEYIKNLICSVG